MRSDSVPDPDTWSKAVVSNGRCLIVPTVGGGEVAFHRNWIVDGDAPDSVLRRNFDFGRIKLVQRTSTTASPALSYTTTACSLAMDSGTFSSTHSVGSTSSGGPHAIVTRDVYPLRQHPNLVMQSQRVTWDPSTALSDRNFYHEIAGPYTLSPDINFSSQLILLSDQQTNPAPFVSLVVMSGYGRVASNPSSLMGFASCYLWDDPSAYTSLGFNVDATDTRVAYMKFGTSDASNREFRFHVLTCCMTSVDRARPDQEAIRTLLGVLRRYAREGASTMQDLATALRVEHVRRWDATWSTNITPEIKVVADDAETSRLDRVKRHLRYALYNVYSSLGSGADVSIYPKVISLADNHGVDDTISSRSVSQQVAAWLMPCTVLLDINVARAHIDFLYDRLADATRTASMYGLSGALFDSVGSWSVSGTRSQSLLLWEVGLESLDVIGTCTVSMNAWNVYRVTQDRDWLRQKAYPVLRGVANFVIGLFEKDPRYENRYFMTNAREALDGELRTHAAFTVNLALIALKNVIEASYVLDVEPRLDWKDVYFNCKAPFFPSNTPLQRVVRLDDAFPTTGGTLTLLEPLAVLTPVFSQIFYLYDNGLSLAVDENLAFYSSLVSNEDLAKPFNIAMLTMLEGIASRTDPSRVTSFYDMLDDLIDASADDIWGNLWIPTSIPPSNQRSYYNHPSSSALLIWALLSIASIAIQGGITETRYKYEEFQIRIARTAYMPREWRCLRVQGLRTGSTSSSTVITTVVENDLVYV